MTEKEQKAELLRVKYHRENLELKEQVKELTQQKQQYQKVLDEHIQRLNEKNKKNKDYSEEINKFKIENIDL